MASRSVVIAPRDSGRVVARRVARCSLAGAHAVVVLASGACRTGRDERSRWLVREARAAYGAEDDRAAGLERCLDRWRRGDPEGARLALAAIAASGGPQAGDSADTLVIASLLAGDRGASLAAEALARAAQVAARLLADDRARACAGLALARAWLGRGQAARALALVERVEADDAAVRVIRAALGVRCAVGAGLVGPAACHAAALEQERADDWVACHRHQARALVAAASGARQEVSRHVARAARVARVALKH
ncbi:MAG: hypothetical protein ACLGHP_02890, partial [Vicinamibacteria bacterium]